VKVLVTGGTGFVGGKIVRELRGRGHEVRALVRDRPRASVLEALGCELVEGDMTDAESLRRAAEGRECVVHLVAIIQGRPEEFERVMTRGTEDLVAAAREAGVGRFVLMSALGTSEASKDAVPYFGAKWSMERAVEGSGIPRVTFRPSFVFGRDGGILPTFLRQVRWSPVTPIVGPGTQRIQPIWVEDVAAYFARAVELDAATGRTFEIGGPDIVSWNELYDRIRRLLRKRRATVHLPFGFMRANAAVLERLPGPTPISRDQVTMLELGDNVPTNEDAVRIFELPLVPLDEQIRRAA
jgi:NADH dehydrogenase